MQNKYQSIIETLYRRIDLIGKRVKYNYYLKNWIDCKKNRKFLENVRKNSKDDTNSNTPLISVQISTYNRSKVLTERAIPSVLRQTYQNFEHPNNDILKVIVSKSHYNQETKEFVNNLKNQYKKTIEFIRIGSSLKLYLIAEGKADIYPRLAPTMDMGYCSRGQGIIEQSEGRVVTFNDKTPLNHNKESLFNPWFICSR